MLDDFDRLLKQAGKLDLSREQLNQLPQGIPQSTRKQIVNAVEKAELDIYTGKDDKILRKLEAKIKFNVPERPAPAGRRARSPARSSSRCEIAEVNEPQTITAPKSAKPLSELQRQLGPSGFGALGSQGGSGSGSSSAAGRARRQSSRWRRRPSRAHSRALPEVRPEREGHRRAEQVLGPADASDPAPAAEPRAA